MFGATGASTYTKSIQSLLLAIQNEQQPEKALFGQAANYFDQIEENTDKIDSLKGQQLALEEQLKSANKRQQQTLNGELKAAKSALKKAHKQQDSERIERLHAALQVCMLVLQLSEGADWDETQLLSAKLLGTLYLLSPREGGRLAHAHNRFKPLYKAVLAVRLLDSSLRAGSVTNDYILSHYDPDSRYSDKDEGLSPFQTEIVTPLILAAMFQDIGMQHGDAQQILKGKTGSMDEFRLLQPQDRLNLLRINHEQSVNYLLHGLGSLNYVGDSREERDIFQQKQQKKNQFIRNILVDAVTPKQGLGNLIKAPQIYTSVIMSTKPDFDIKQLPKAALLLEQIAKQGTISETAARNLVSIVGHFPQGYGVVYLAKSDRGKYLDSYEYAIVNRLNPENVRVPRCRIVTRNLRFMSFGQDVRVSLESNLYYPIARKKLEVVSKVRLEEILTLLYHNYEQRKELDLIPYCWEPYEYFTFIKHQNLWNSATSTSI